MKIFILAISHECGGNYSAHTSRRLARSALAKWCTSNWTSPDAPTSSGVELTITEYFDYDAAIGGSEYAEITQSTLER